MRSRGLILVLACLAACGAPARAQTQEASPEQEQADLNRAVNDAAGSPTDFVRALEKHLAKYPLSLQRPQIEKALAKSAMEMNDRARIILYGERVLSLDVRSTDLPLLDKVTRAILDSDDAESGRRALVLAKRYLAVVESMRSRSGEGHMSEGQWAEEVNKGRSRALVLAARATGKGGNPEDAVKLAKGAWEALPNSEAARELGRWLSKVDKDTEAVEYYADAFTIEDGRSNEADKARDRVHLNELFTKLHGSEKGLGEVILQAWDRMAAMKKQRLELGRLRDPNMGATEVADFTIPNAEGTGSLSLASLKGKAVVMDFWATWCGPCRVQHPMIENVKKRFAQAGNVVFLSIDSDDDHSLVAPFLKEMKWDHPVYFDAGLGSLLKITAIPTVVVLDSTGKLSSRMAGFLPERFEEMLAQRIEEAQPRAAIPVAETGKN